MLIPIYKTMRDSGWEIHAWVLPDAERPLNASNSEPNFSLSPEEKGKKQGKDKKLKKTLKDSDKPGLEED